MGKDEAMVFLTNTAAKSKPLEVVRKLYLESRPFNLAVKGNCVRYINDNHELVEEDGASFANELNERIRTAMIHATNDLIKQNITNNTTDQLYEFYDIGSI